MKLKVKVRDVITKQEEDWEFMQDPQTGVFYRVDGHKCFCLHYEIPTGHIMSVISIDMNMIFKFPKSCPDKGYKMAIELNKPFGHVQRDERYIVLDVPNV